MKAKKIIKIIIDTAMLILLSLLMAYSLIGEAAHEWLGPSVFLLFILHHLMNPAWLKTIFRGRYTPLRIYITGVNFLPAFDRYAFTAGQRDFDVKAYIPLFRRRRYVPCPDGCIFWRITSL